MAVGDIVRLPRRLISDRTTQTTTGDSVWIHASFPEYLFSLVDKRDSVSLPIRSEGAVKQLCETDD